MLSMVRINYLNQWLSQKNSKFAGHFPDNFNGVFYAKITRTKLVLHIGQADKFIKSTIAILANDMADVGASASRVAKLRLARSRLCFAGRLARRLRPWAGVGCHHPSPAPTNAMGHGLGG
jgi:hypothetical protein